MKIKTAIYGGAFDPPQLAHETIARETIREFGLEKLYVVPSGLHAFKTYKTSQENRKKIMEIFVKTIDSPSTELCNVFLDGIRVNTTLETDRYFTEILGYSPYQIFGSDNIDSMWKWDPTGEVALRLPKIIIQRPGHEIDISKIANFVILDPFKNNDIAILSSTQVRENIRNRVYIGMDLALCNFIRDNKLYI